MTRDANATDPEEPLVGDPDGLNVRNGDEYDYVLTRPDGASFGFDAIEVSTLRELLNEMQGDG